MMPWLFCHGGALISSITAQQVYLMSKSSKMHGADVKGYFPLKCFFALVINIVWVFFKKNER